MCRSPKAIHRSFTVVGVQLECQYVLVLPSTANFFGPSVAVPDVCSLPAVTVMSAAG